MAITIESLLAALNGSSGESAIGGFSIAGLTNKPSRAIFVGGDNEARTPLYEFLGETQQPIVDNDGNDCWTVEGAFLGLRGYVTKDGKYAGAKKISVDLDFGNEKVAVITGLGTRSALGLLQSLCLYRSAAGESPKFVRLVFTRGKQNAKVAFVNVHASPDGLAWDSIFTGDDATFALPEGAEVAEHNRVLFDRVNGQEKPKGKAKKVAQKAAPKVEEEEVMEFEFEEAF